METFQHVISVIEKEMAKNPKFLQKEIGTRNTNNVTVALINCLQQTVSMMRRTYHRADQRPVPLKLGTLTTVENAHNTADTKYSVHPVAKITVVSKDRRIRH